MCSDNLKILPVFSSRTGNISIILYSDLIIVPIVFCKPRAGVSVCVLGHRACVTAGAGGV